MSDETTDGTADREGDTDANEHDEPGAHKSSTEATREGGGAATLPERIAALERVVRLQADRLNEIEDGERSRLGRRSLLKAAGVTGLLTVGAGHVSADPQGEVGSSANPLRVLHTEAIGGGVVGGERIDNLLGPGLGTEETGDGIALSASGRGIDVAGVFGPIAENVRTEDDGVVRVDAEDDVIPQPSVADDGAEVVRRVNALDFGANLSVTESGGDALVAADVEEATNWTDAGDGLLGPGNDYNGIDTTEVRTDRLSGGVTGGTDVTNLTGEGLRLTGGALAVALGNGLTTGGGGRVALGEDSVSVAGNDVSLGESTDVAHADLTGVGASDHHTRPSAGDGLTDSEDTFAIAPAEFAGAFLSATESGDLSVDIGRGLQPAGEGFLLQSESEPVPIDQPGAITVALGNGLNFDLNRIAVASGAIGTTELDIPFEDLSTLFGTPVTAGSKVDLDGNDLADGGTTVWDASNDHVPQDRLENDGLTITAGTGLTGGGAVTLGGTTTLGIASDGVTGTEIDLSTIAGSGLSASGDMLDVTTSSPWQSGTDEDGLLEPSGSETGIDVADVQTDSLNGGLTGDTDVTNLIGDGLTVSSSALTADLGNALSFDGSGRIAVGTNTVKVAGNTVSLGGATDVAHADLSEINSDDHHARPTAGDGLTDSSNTFAVDARALAGSYLSNQEVNNLTLNLGSGLEGDGADNIRVDPGAIAGTGLTEEGSISLGIESDGVTGSEIDLADIAGTNLAVDTTNAELDAAAGETNDGTNLGTGTGVYDGKSGSTLQFRSLVGGSNVTLSTGSGEITIDATDTDTDTHVAVSDDGSQVAADVPDINFGTDLSVSSDGDGSVTVDSTGSSEWTDGDADNLLEPTDSNKTGIEKIDTVQSSAGTALTLTTDAGIRALTLAPGGTDLSTNVNTRESSANAPNVVGGHPNNNTGSATPSGATISGGGGAGENVSENIASGNYATVGGGENNTAGSTNATVGGGTNNSATSDHATVGGGQANTASAGGATVAGGGDYKNGNTASKAYAFVGGGTGNSASADSATVSGGSGNSATDRDTVVGGGFGNTASGAAATVPGGQNNLASGVYSFAAGRQAKTETAGGTAHAGAFVWADSSDTSVRSTAADEVRFQAGGGFAIEGGDLAIEGSNAITDASGNAHLRPNDGGSLEVLRSLELGANTLQSTTSASPLTIRQDSNSVEGGAQDLTLETVDSSGFGGVGDIVLDADSDSQSPAAIVCNTSGTERARVDANGLNVDTISDNGSGQVSLGSTLDLQGNDVSLTENFDMRVGSSESTAIDKVDFTGGLDKDILRVNLDEKLVDLLNSDLRIRNNGSIEDGFGENHLTINGGGPLEVNKALDVEAGAVENSTGGLTLDTSTGTSGSLTLRAGSGLFAYGLNTGSGAALEIDGDGGIVKASSSARYKRNIQPLSIDPDAVLELEPRSFEYVDTGQADVGLIAEEVAETVPQLVNHDERGRPDSVNYDRLPVYLLPELRAHRDRLADLDAEIDAKDARIADQRDRIERLASRVEAGQARTDELEAENERLRERTTELEARNEELETRNAELESRIDRIEDHLGIDAGREVADD